MAILNMKRIEILGMLEDSKAIVDFLQRQGSVQISDLQEEESHFYRLSTSGTVSQFDKFGNVADSAMSVLNQYTAAKGDGLLSSFEPRPVIPVSEFLEKSKEADKVLNQCYTINSLHKDIQDCKVEIAKDKTLIDQLTPWAKLDIAPEMKRTAQSAVFIGSFAAPLDREAILTQLAEAAPGVDGDVEVISSDKNLTCVVAICHKDNADEFEQALHGIGFVNTQLAGRKLPAEQISELQEDITKQTEKIAATETEIKSYDGIRKDIKFLQDYLTVRSDKYRALDKVAMDDHIFVLTGYVPENKAEKLAAALEKKYDAAVSVTDVDPDDEMVPVELDNNKLGQTMESVTGMYSLPSHHDLDPNFIMTVFYFCLFGLMLGDAGYGAIMTIICLIAKLKIKNMEPRKKATVNYGMLCGIFTFIWGALQNSWFGDLPKWISNGLASNAPNDFLSTHHLYWFEPLANGNITRFLLLCFFIGILHLFLAICVNLYKMVKQGDTLGGLVGNVPILLILIGVIPVINKFIGGRALYDNPTTLPIGNFIDKASPVLYGLLIAGAALVVVGPAILAIRDRKKPGKVITSVFGGLYELYNTASGYLGDILSYARLLALGLCTGVIASVINQLAATPLGGNWIIFIIIFILGHTVNLAINLIGAYVHTNRLQYVEFFSKFYEGGGKKFEPLGANTKNFTFKEEV